MISTVLGLKYVYMCMCIYLQARDVVDIVQAFKKYEILTRKREAEIMREEETQKVEKMSQMLPPKSTEKPVSTRETSEDELPIVVPEDTSQGGEGEGGGRGGGGAKEPATPPKLGTAAETKEKPVKKDSEGQKKRASAFNYTSDVYNGADMDDYKWSQTMTEVEIKVALPEKTPAKHVRVDIRNEYLKVEILKPERKVYTCT